MNNQYMKLYATLQERGLPLAFHGGYYWQEPVIAQFQRFLGMHAVAFVLWNLVHLVNWVLPRPARALPQPRRRLD